LQRSQHAESGVFLEGGHGVGGEASVRTVVQLKHATAGLGQKKLET